MAEDRRPGAPWRHLHELTLEAMPRAYAPYSGYPVGAIALVDDGHLVSGCNVEGVGCGAALCTKCGLVSELVCGGGGKLLAFVYVSTGAETIVLCGRCGQLLAEHTDPAMVFDMPDGLISVAEVLSFAFGPGNLNVVERTAPFASKEN